MRGGREEAREREREGGHTHWKEGRKAGREEGGKAARKAGEGVGFGFRAEKVICFFPTGSRDSTSPQPDPFTRSLFRGFGNLVGLKDSSKKQQKTNHLVHKHCHTHSAPGIRSQLTPSTQSHVHEAGFRV